MNYRNAKYLSDGICVDCEIEHPDHGWVPYTLDPSDSDMTVDNDILLANMIAEDGISPYVPPTQEELDLSASYKVRSERNGRLANEVDPIAGNALRWAALDAAAQAAWAAYRQALLDVPQQAGFPHDVTWPVKP